MPDTAARYRLMGVNVRVSAGLFAGTVRGGSECWTSAYCRACISCAEIERGHCDDALRLRRGVEGACDTLLTGD